jgi:phospholipase C
LENRDTASRDVVIRDESYGAPVRQVSLPSRQHSIVELDASASQGWYDFTVRTEDVTWRFAGRVETGKWSITDPSMGRE